MAESISDGPRARPFDGDAGFAGTPHHISRAAATREHHPPNQFARVEHVSVTDRTGGTAERQQIGDIGIAGYALLLSGFLSSGDQPSDADTEPKVNVLTTVRHFTFAFAREPDRAKAALELRIRPHFVVALTFKTARYADRIRVLLVSIDASHNLRHFLNLVNCASKKGSAGREQR